MKRILICVLVLVMALSLVPGAALAGDSVDASTEVKFMNTGFEITGITEDCALKKGEDLTLRVSATGLLPFTFLWEVSIDGGANWHNAAGATNAETYEITDAAENTPATTPYIYRVTVTDGGGYSATAQTRVLVSDAYIWRSISLRNGDVNVSAYMLNKTRLVVTPLPDNKPAAAELAQQLNTGHLALAYYDVKLVNRDNTAADAYFGTVHIDFNVGSQYNDDDLRVFHLHGSEVRRYSGTVKDGMLSITVKELSPFMVEVPAEYVRTVTASAGTGGSITPSGTVNVAYGSSKTFTFLPDVGYEINTVRVDGQTVACDGNSYTFPDITDSTSISVTFRSVAPSDVLHTVSTNAPAHGAIYPSGDIKVQHGCAVTIYFYPDDGYELSTVTINNVPVSVIANSVTLSAVTADTTVDFVFTTGTSQSPDVYKVIAASAGVNGSISPMGDTRVEYGGGMYFYIIPDSGYEVDKLFIDSLVTPVNGNSYSFVNVVDAHTIRVTFRQIVTPTYYTITASAGANGAISPNGGVQVAQGGAQTFSFVPDAGYELDTVTVDGVTTAVSGSAYTFTDVTSDHTISATFRQVAAPTYYTITAASGANGAVSPSGSVQVVQGGAQTFVFTPDTGYKVDTVTVDGAAVSVTGNTYRFADVTGDHAIRVAFRRTGDPQPTPTCHTITAAAGAHGSISPAGDVSVEENDTQTFYLIPDAGYEVASVTVDGTVTAVSGNAYTFAGVASDHTISVTFKPAAAQVYHTITASAGDNGSVSPDGDVRIAEGFSSYFYFLPDEGYEVDRVTVDGRTVAADEGSYCFEDVSADHSIHVTFREAAGEDGPPVVYHTISVSAGANGSISPSGEVRVPDGGAQTFYMIADEGYEVAAIYVNGEKQDVLGSQITLDDVTGDTELSVTFAPVDDSVASGEPHCFLCGWAGRDISPWCWLAPLIILAAGGGAIWLALRRRHR